MKSFAKATKVAIWPQRVKHLYKHIFFKLWRKHSKGFMVSKNSNKKKFFGYEFCFLKAFLHITLGYVFPLDNLYVSILLVEQNMCYL